MKTDCKKAEFPKYRLSKGQHEEGRWISSPGGAKAFWYLHLPQTDPKETSQELEHVIDFAQ